MQPYIINLAITTYLFAQGLALTFWGSLADLFGRRIILMCTLFVFVVANIVLALAPNAGVLIAFRAIQAIGSASTISLGGGVITDIVSSAERGGYLGFFSGVESVLRLMHLNCSSFRQATVS